MLRTLFILAILIPGFLAALRWRYAALLMYLWFALFRPQDWLWIDITTLRVPLVLGVVMLAPAIVSGVLPNVTHPLSIGMILFLATSVAAQVGAIQPAIGWVWIDFLVRLFIACLMLVTLASESKRLFGVFSVIAVSLGFHAAKAGLAFLLGGGIRFADGLAGAFVDNNGYALGTVMIIPLLVATAQNVEVIYTGRLVVWIRRGLYAAVPLCMFAVVGTYSRGGFVALAVATLTFVLLQRRRLPALAGLTLALTLFLLVVPIPKSYLDRLQTIQTYNQIEEESAQSRPHFWRVGLDMVAAHPMGIGLKQYEVAYDQYDFSHGRYGHHRAVHNSHVQVLAELGYAGAAVWIGLFGYACFACLRVRARAADHPDPAVTRFLLTVSNALLTSITSFVVGGAFLSLALNDLTWLTFGLVAALDRVSIQLCEAPAVVMVRAPIAVPLAFRAVDTFAIARKGQL